MVVDGLVDGDDDVVSACIYSQVWHGSVVCAACAPMASRELGATYTVHTEDSGRRAGPRARHFWPQRL